ncbi:hypothetical protein ACN38_g6331 [Penicillium nordicum]|uniref:Uncharacterized protein n=1 Tax=Penicillium nordicum TaxID=229535 RepID=A0A0M8P038_9EURO|nr:hypothetical protein ACN38_g6331 [Penicillium nordicum]
MLEVTLSVQVLDALKYQNYYQFGAVAQLVARATPVRKVIWSRRVSLIFFFCFVSYFAPHIPLSPLREYLVFLP